jgi:hypothetical protein
MEKKVACARPGAGPKMLAQRLAGLQGEPRIRTSSRLCGATHVWATQERRRRRSPTLTGRRKVTSSTSTAKHKAGTEHRLLATISSTVPAAVECRAQLEVGQPQGAASSVLCKPLCHAPACGRQPAKR